MNGRRRVLDLFAATAGGEPDVVVRAPGRVNLIGDHTDYNGGFVLPMAIERATWIAARGAANGRVRATSEELGPAEFPLEDLAAGEGWAEYVKGVAHAMQGAGLTTPGWEGAVATDVPVGAGLSSSAALELAAALTFTALAGDPWDPARAALLAQQAENEWVGVATGIMDQLVVATATAGSAKLIDCRSLEGADHPLPDGLTAVVLDTTTRRRLEDSGYADRRDACERVAALLGVELLRDVTLADLDAADDDVPPGDMARARHVVEENGRVLAAADALDRGDGAALGELMASSHASLRDLFEISSLPLEAMVAAADRSPGCLGARLTGGGFAGCAVALVESDALAAFGEKTAREYRSRTGLDATIYPSRPAGGASVE